MQESHNALVLTLRGDLFVCYSLNSDQEKSLNDAFVPAENQASCPRKQLMAVAGTLWSVCHCIDMEQVESLKM